MEGNINKGMKVGVNFFVLYPHIEPKYNNESIRSIDQITKYDKKTHGILKKISKHCELYFYIPTGCLRRTPETILKGIKYKKLVCRYDSPTNLKDMDVVIDDDPRLYSRINNDKIITFLDNNKSINKCTYYTHKEFIKRFKNTLKEMDFSTLLESTIQELLSDPHPQLKKNGGIRTKKRERYIL